jgi:peptide chain release factor 1
MLEKYPKIKQEFEEIEAGLSDSAILCDHKKVTQLQKKHTELTKLVELFEKLKKTQEKIEQTFSLIKIESDPEIIAMAEEDVAKLRHEKELITKKIEIELLPKDDNDEKDVIMEIRAGAGGDESALFAAELYRMYSKFAEQKRLSIEIINLNENEIGGIKEIIFGIKGKNAFRWLKFESGVHRVQRVPETESSGRVHTSTVTVAVLPEAEEVDIDIAQNDVRVDVFRSSGPGGQSVNTTDSAVRLTHIPSGLIVTCQDEKSQIKNKEKAFRVLRSRLLALKQEEEAKKRGDERKSQIGTGDRSEKIRTYNFPQDRVTDHRIGFSVSNLPGFMNGNIETLIIKLLEKQEEEALKNL